MSIIQQHIISQSDNHFISEYRHENPTLGTGNYSSKWSQHFFGQHVVDDAGFIYVTGRSGRFGGKYFPPDATVRSISKLTQTGQVIFSKDFNTLYPHFERMFYADNHIYGVGRLSTSYNSSGTLVGSDALIMKLTTDLNIVWYRMLGNDDTTTDYEDFEGFAIDSSNNVYVSGEGYRSPGTYGAMSTTVAKYNSSGTLQWKKLLKYESGNNNTSESFYGGNHMIHCDTSGNLYLSNQTANAGGGNSSNGTPACNWYMNRSCNLKLNSSGSVIWRKARRSRWTTQTGGPSSYTGCYRSYGDHGSSGLDSNNNFYSAFSHYSLSHIPSYNSYRSDAFSLLKRNSSGTVQWEKCFYVTNTSNSSFATYLAKQMQFDNDDNIYLACRSQKESGGLYIEPIIILKFNSSGNLQWARKISRSNLKSGNLYVPYASSFKVHKDKEYFTISGSFRDNNASPDIYHGYILKLPIDGSKTGTYGYWSYSTYNELTFSNNHPNSNVDITGVEHSTTNITTYNNPMVDRSSVTANNITLTTGAHPAANYVESIP